jgi:hypothetical protein
LKSEKIIQNLISQKYEFILSYFTFKVEIIQTMESYENYYVTSVYRIDASLRNKHLFPEHETIPENGGFLSGEYIEPDRKNFGIPFFL